MKKPSADAIRCMLHDPDHIAIEEYRRIHARVLEVLEQTADADWALSAVLESCNLFIDWANATKRVLEPLSPCDGSTCEDNATQERDRKPR